MKDLKNNIHSLTGRTASAWRLVASRELHDLWFGGKIPILLVLFTVVLSLVSFLLATNSELSIIPPKEMVNMVLQITITVSMLICLIISANAISGEREKGTLESHLLAPISRRQLILGKLLAALSPWPAVLAISSVYVIILSPSMQFSWYALLWGGILGSLLVIISAGFGLLVSIGSNSNKSSLSISLVVFLLSLVPTQLPGTAQTGAVGVLFKRMNPMEATVHLLEKLLVNNRTITEMYSWLLSPVLLALLLLGLIFAYKHSKLGLQGEFKFFSRNHLSGLAILFVLANIVLTPSAMALEDKMKQTNQTEQLRISIDRSYKITKTGENFSFNTSVTNNGIKQLGPLVVAMNIVNLENGASVDPEDWSPLRTLNITEVQPGASLEQSWNIQPILEGNYLIYMVVTSKPGEIKSSSQPVASSAIHLTVEPHIRFNPRGVLPVVIGMPLVSLVLWLGLRTVRRRGID